MDTRGEPAARASISVRVVPEGVEPLTRLAAENGHVESTRTNAEDLADVVADTARQTQMLQTQRRTLSDYQTRDGLAVADLIALSGELAALETRLDALDRSAADQRRRIETHLLTIHIDDSRRRSGAGRIAGALSGFTESVAEGLAEALALLGYGLPFAILAFPLALLWRALWRRATRSRDRPA